MSLLIGCKNAHGIVMAADSKAIDFQLDREPVERRVTRLHQLTPASVIMAGGAAEGEKMCLALKDFLVEKPPRMATCLNHLTHGKDIAR
jgi:hypothetical protein